MKAQGSFQEAFMSSDDAMWAMGINVAESIKQTLAAASNGAVNHAWQNVQSSGLWFHSVGVAGYKTVGAVFSFSDLTVLTANNLVNGLRNELAIDGIQAALLIGINDIAGWGANIANKNKREAPQQVCLNPWGLAGFFNNGATPQVPDSSGKACT
jgi:hypothetical protein